MFRNFYFISSFLTLLSCSEKQLDEELTNLTRYYELSANPLVDTSQQLRNINSPEAQLGKLLFFSKTLSGRGDVACATCHHPFLGGDDDLSLSIGVEPVDADILGRERLNLTGQILVPRNAPTTFNSSLWKKHLFHDGRVERLNEFTELPAKISSPDEEYGNIDIRSVSLLQAQAGFPVTSQHEMRALYKDSSSNDSLRKALVQNLVFATEVKKDRDAYAISWRELFLNVYPDDKDIPLSKLFRFSRIRHLLAEYEVSQVFVNTPWSQYLAGDLSALTASQKRGAILFYKDVNQGGAECVRCHSGSFFTDESFHVSGFPHIGVGKDIRGDDTGRFLRTGIYDDRYAFRTPSLINVEVTAPYGHNGVFTSLDQLIKYHIDPIAGSKYFDYSLAHLEQKNISNEHSKEYTAKAVAQLIRLKKQGDSLLKGVKLSDSQIDDLVSFMFSLTDPCIKDRECLMPWVPNVYDPVPDDSLIYFEPKLSNLRR